MTPLFSPLKIQLHQSLSILFVTFFFPISYLSNYTAFQGSSAGLIFQFTKSVFSYVQFPMYFVEVFCFFVLHFNDSFFLFQHFYLVLFKILFFFLLRNSFLSFNSLDILQVSLRSIFIWFFSLFSCSYWLTLRWWVCLRAL